MPYRHHGRYYYAAPLSKGGSFLLSLILLSLICILYPVFLCSAFLYCQSVPVIGRYIFGLGV